MNKNRALGKGLSSLLPRPKVPVPISTASASVGDLKPAEAPKPADPPAAPVPHAPLTELAIDAIQANPNQPRKEFRQAQLLELAVSITRDGIIQPLVVRNIGQKDAPKYELVAGERRLRAARLAGLEKVPVVLQEVSDERLLEIAIYKGESVAF